MEDYRHFQSRFELKPGRYVYVPTEECQIYGRDLLLELGKRWEPDGFVFHLRRKAGHIAALKAHLSSNYFARRDISDFYGNITRSKVLRGLRRIGIHGSRLSSIVRRSLVRHGGRVVIPYGYPQSAELASLAMHRSEVMRYVRGRGSDIAVSFYMDDIVISGQRALDVDEFLKGLDSAALKANLPINLAKSTSASAQVIAFNCTLRNNHMSLTFERLQTISEDIDRDLALGALERAEARLRYVAAVNDEQARELKARHIL